MSNLEPGFIILDKPTGMSSQGAVSRVRKCLKIKKAGHTGTLDPLATGVLPVALGEATKVIPYLEESKKVYRVKGILGRATDTYDAEGEETDLGDPSNVSRKDLESVLEKFKGSISQKPPPYSAIKLNGKPLYTYARQGKSVPLNSREVVLHRLEIESFENPEFTLKVTCSRGTYIRSLVHDIGLSLGCFAYVSELRRLCSGSFSEGKAITLEFLGETMDAVKEKIVSIEDCLAGLPTLKLRSERELKMVSSGVALGRINKDIQERGLFGKTVAVKFKDKIVALIEGKGEKAFEYKRVLNRESADFF